MNNRAGNDNGNHQDVQGPINPLQEQSLAVDLAAAEIDSQILTAHKYPRSLDTVIKKISTMACYNEQAAENCVYALPRGGKPIIGASIGFANIVAQSWGNCRVGARHTYTDRKEKVVEAQGVFHDLESNSATSLSVQRRISGRDGRIYNDDMIAVTGNAAASIARRNAILNAVPRALWFPIWENALAIVRGTSETFAERKDKALKAFAQFGVKPEQIFMFLGLKGEADLTIEHIPTLRGMYQQLRDGTITVEEMFDPRKMTGMGFEQVVNPLADVDDGEGDGEEGEPPGGGEPAKPAAAQQAKQAPSEAGKPAGEPAGAGASGQGATAASEQAGQERRKPGRPKKTEAKPAEPEQQQQQQPTGGPDEAEQEAQERASAAAANAAPKEPAAAVQPTNSAEYEAHCMAYINTATVAADLDNRWRGEKDLRGICRVVEDTFTRCYGAYKAKLTALRGG